MSSLRSVRFFHFTSAHFRSLFSALYVLIASRCPAPLIVAGLISSSSSSPTSTSFSFVFISLLRDSRSSYLLHSPLLFLSFSLFLSFVFFFGTLFEVALFLSSGSLFFHFIISPLRAFFSALLCEHLIIRIFRRHHIFTFVRSYSTGGATLIMIPCARHSLSFVRRRINRHSFPYLYALRRLRAVWPQTGRSNSRQSVLNHNPDGDKMAPFAFPFFFFVFHFGHLKMIPTHTHTHLLVEDGSGNDRLRLVTLVDLAFPVSISHIHLHFVRLILFFFCATCFFYIFFHFSSSSPHLFLISPSTTFFLSTAFFRKVRSNMHECDIKTCVLPRTLNPKWQSAHLYFINQTVAVTCGNLWIK